MAVQYGETVVRAVRHDDMELTYSTVTVTVLMTSRWSWNPGGKGAHLSPLHDSGEAR